VVAGAGCARGVSATVPAQAAAQASILSLIGLCRQANLERPQMTNIRVLKIVGGPHDGQTREVECHCDYIVLTHRTVVWKSDVTDPTLAVDENHTYVLYRLRTGPTPSDEFAFLAHSDLSLREAQLRGSLQNEETAHYGHPRAAHHSVLPADSNIVAMMMRACSCHSGEWVPVEMARMMSLAMTVVLTLEGWSDGAARRRAASRALVSSWRA
jgi:hypothetical protein